MWLLGRNHWLTKPRSALGQLCLFNLLFLIVGIPIPHSRQKDKSVAYPCMDHACGCMNAEQCWRGCCCYTREEKLAWAKENGVTPPAFVLAQSEEEPKSCCSAHKACHESSSCCEGGKKTATKTCCKSHAEEQVDEEVHFTWLVTMQAMKCHGQDGWSLLTSVIVVDVPDVVEKYEAPSLPEVIPCDDETAFSLNADPALPPPRG
ncbi:MAG TPA: hypothetical protein PLN21_14240 [Gemmatales bacterium]|nr:hypothetical protein [Gemmatales bacterium]